MTDFACEVLRFVNAVRACPSGARRRDLPLANRNTDLARQYARKRGLVEYVEREGVKGKRWYATALKKAD